MQSGNKKCSFRKNNTYLKLRFQSETVSDAMRAKLSAWKEQAGNQSALSKVTDQQSARYTKSSDVISFLP